MDIRIKSSERCCFFGRVGSGKTTLAKSLLRLVARYAVLDPKHTFREPGVPIVKQFEKRHARQIIRVPFDLEQLRWMLAIERMWREKNRVIYVDEFSLVGKSRTALDPAIGKAIRTGRERNVGVWIGQQRPKELPSAVFTEAEHFFVFQLQFAADREKVASFTGDKMLPLLEGLRGHQFVYYNVLSDEMQLMELRLRRSHAARTS